MVQDNCFGVGASPRAVFIRGIGIVTPGQPRQGDPASEALPPGSIIRVARPWYVDPGLRALGLVFAGLATLAIWLLVDAVQAAPNHPASLVEMGLAAIGVLGTSLGGVMMFEGVGLYDLVVPAKPWLPEL